MATICAMEPRRKDCAEAAPLDKDAKVLYKWVVTQQPEEPCLAEMDRHGYCGNPDATTTMSVTCQKHAVSVDGAFQILKYAVNVDTEFGDGDGTDDDADGADDDGDGADDDGDGADDDGDGADDDADGADDNADGADDDGDGTDDDADGADDEADGTDDEADGADDEADGAEDDADGAEDDADGTDDEADGADDEADGADDEADGADDEADGAEDEADGTEDDADGADDEADGADDEADGADDEADGADDEADDAEDEADGAEDEATSSSANATNECTEAMLPDHRTFECANRDCEVLVRKTRNMGECFSMYDLECGPMTQLKEERCWAPASGEFVTDEADMAGTECDGVEGVTLADCAETVVPCSDEPFFKYSEWEECSKSCDVDQPASCDGARSCTLEGTQSRTAECLTVNTTTMETTESNGCAISTQKSLSQDCTVQCYNAVSKFRSVEGLCSATECDTTGTKLVDYTLCVAGDMAGCTTFDGVTTAGPGEGEPCQGAPCNPCADNKCVTDNTESALKSEDGMSCTCTCKDGFAGSRCHRATSIGAIFSLLDANGQPCSTILDKKGSCCDQGLDGCGYCKGQVVEGMDTFRVGYDFNSQCCSGSTEDVFLTGDFTCCKSSDDLDECGVCNGSSSTCSKKVGGGLALSGGKTAADFGNEIKSLLPASLQLVSTSESPGRRLQQAAVPVTYTIAPSTVSFSSGKLAGKYIVAGTTSTALSAPPSAPKPGLVGTADNGVCETGEPSGSSDCVTPQDCPRPSVQPDGAYIGNPMSTCGGNGVCNRVLGTCLCVAGYAGAACDQCDINQGYADVPIGTLLVCSKLASDYAIPLNSTVPTSSSGTTDRSAGAKKGLATGGIVGIAVGVVGGVAIIAGVAYYLVRVKGAKDIGPA
jgi:hypothetical protein